MRAILSSKRYFTSSVVVYNILKVPKSCSITVIVALSSRRLRFLPAHLERDNSYFFLVFLSRVQPRRGTPSLRPETLSLSVDLATVDKIPDSPQRSEQNGGAIHTILQISKSSKLVPIYNQKHTTPIHSIQTVPLCGAPTALNPFGGVRFE